MHESKKKKPVVSNHFVLLLKVIQLLVLLCDKKKKRRHLNKVRVGDGLGEASSTVLLLMRERPAEKMTAGVGLMDTYYSPWRRGGKGKETWSNVRPEEGGVGSGVGGGGVTGANPAGRR